MDIIPPNLDANSTQVDVTQACSLRSKKISCVGMVNSEVKRILLLQCALVGGAMLIGLATGEGWGIVVSVFLGGFLVLVPSMAYVKVAYARPNAVPSLLVKAHFLAEAIKYAISIVLFFFVFVIYKDVSMLGLWSGIFTAISGYWFGLLIKN